MKIGMPYCPTNRLCRNVLLSGLCHVNTSSMLFMAVYIIEHFLVSFICISANDLESSLEVSNFKKKKKNFDVKKKKKGGKNVPDRPGLSKIM